MKTKTQLLAELQEEHDRLRAARTTIEEKERHLERQRIVVRALRTERDVLIQENNKLQHALDNMPATVPVRDPRKDLIVPFSGAEVLIRKRFPDNPKTYLYVGITMRFAGEVKWFVSQDGKRATSTVPQMSHEEFIDWCGPNSDILLLQRTKKKIEDAWPMRRQPLTSEGGYISRYPYTLPQGKFA